MERITTGTMEPTYDGGYVEKPLVKYAWRCDGCRAVWDRKSYAQDCESRKHRYVWFQKYTSGPVVNGQPSNVRFYIRRGLRRDRLAVEPAVPPPPAPAPKRPARSIDPILVNPAFGG
jgi:hypothetical protein